jgi:hypothetical protein
LIEEGQAAAFVAPYWWINPNRALDVVTQFYARLAAGDPIGLAMREIRRGFERSSSEDPPGFDFSPSCLAYAVISNPDLTVTFT